MFLFYMLSSQKVGKLVYKNLKMEENDFFLRMLNKSLNFSGSYVRYFSFLEKDNIYDS